LKLIEDMSKKYDLGKEELEEETTEEKDAEFISSVEELLKQFAQLATELKSAHDKGLANNYVVLTTKVSAQADIIMNEVKNFELLTNLSDDIMITQEDAARMSQQGLKNSWGVLPTAFKPHFWLTIEAVRTTSQTLTAKGAIAAEPWPSPTAGTEMLQSLVPCVIAVKKLVILAKEGTAKSKQIMIEEKRKRDEWNRECLANERVKKLFQMWESQVISETTHQSIKSKSGISQLSEEDIQMLKDPEENISFEEINGIRKVKGGKVSKLIEFLTSHEQIQDQEFLAVFLMTMHSFISSPALLDNLMKRYEITPPYGLNQRMFELYLDKKVVQVRLRF
jgi:hypothetical protein